MTACLFHHSDDRDPHPATVGFLCKSGMERLTQHLAELPALAHWLHANLSGGSGSGFGDYTTGSREKPLPIKTGIADHLTQITDTVNSWARLVAEERDLRGPWRPLPSDGWPERDRLRRAVEQTASLEDLCTFLLAHLDWTVQQLWVDDFATEIEDLTSTAHGLAPSRPSKHRMAAPCPTCNAFELSRMDGDSFINCGSCGRLWTEDEYVRLALVLAAEVDLPEWSPVALIAERFDLNPARVWKWKQRGLLQAKREHGQVLVRLVCDVTTEGAA